MTCICPMMPNTSQKYGFLLLEDFSNMVLASAVEPLRAANYCASRQWFSWQLFSLHGQSVTSSSGLRLLPDAALAEAGELEALFVICGYGARQHSTRELLSAIREARRRSHRIGGADAGSWILAKAGLLEGRRATIHWLDLQAFEEEFSNVEASPERFVIDGPALTAGGATTVLELMLRIIRETCGEAVAFDVSNTFVYNSDRIGIDNRGARSLSVSTREPQLIQAIDEMRRTIADPVSLDRLAEVSNCSRRTLHRLFLRELDIPPGRYYELVRLAHARSLVEETAMSAYEIAASTGYETTSSLSKAFKKRFGVSLMSLRRATKA